MKTKPARPASDGETRQLPLEYARIIEVPEFLECSYHGQWGPVRWYYEDDEIIQMVDEQDFIDCPLCLAGMVGIE